MKAKILFFFALLAVLIFMYVLLGGSSEVWDGACGHKQEYGLFPYYRAGSEQGLPAECASGIMFTGLAKTIGALAVSISAIYFGWRKHLKRGI